MRNKFIIGLVLAGLLVGGCAKKFDNMLDNPNFPTPESANADLYLSEVQLGFASFFDQASSFGMTVTRYIAMQSVTYSNAYTPESFNGIWSTAYTRVFKHANALIPIAEEQKKYVNVAMAKILKAYTMMTLVDMFGDIPYDEANLGFDNTNPKVSKGSDVYAKAIALLDEAITDLGKTPGAYPGVQDLYYGASNAAGRDKWATLARTLKLKAYTTTRLVDNGAKAKIDALLTQNLIDATDGSEDFEFKYSRKQANPNSRHPRYNSNYSAAGSASDYMGTYFMWTLVQEKGSGANNDPRTRYYFYRQRTNYAGVNEQSASCSVAPPPAHYPATMPYCLLITGYWGRDHGDGSGIPPDANLRTTVGIFPCGGEFDDNQGTSVSLNRGAQGAGIQPIWSASFTQFVKAEAALMLGTAGDAKALMEAGIRQSIKKTIEYPTVVGVSIPVSQVPDAARIDGYVTKVKDLYDAAPNTSKKLDVMMKEYYIALWGNGMEAWNMYRRTGKPENIQLTRAADPGPFTRSMVYPANYVNLNQNAAQKTPMPGGQATQVFWDNNPAGFIK